jgi:hypothetical protein
MAADNADPLPELVEGETQPVAMVPDATTKRDEVGFGGHIALQ